MFKAYLNTVCLSLFEPVTQRSSVTRPALQYIFATILGTLMIEFCLWKGTVGKHDVRYIVIYYSIMLSCYTPHSSIFQVGIDPVSCHNTSHSCEPWD